MVYTPGGSKGCGTCRKRRVLVSISFVQANISFLKWIISLVYPTITKTEGTVVNVTLSVRSQYARMPSVFHNRPEMQWI